MDATKSAFQPQQFTPEEIARLVRAYREDLGLKQINLAQEAGVDERTIQRIEAGGGSVSAETLRRIARAFKLSDPDFFTKPYAVPTEEWKKHNIFVDVSRADKGSDFIPLLSECVIYQFAHPDPDNDEHAEAFGRLLDCITDHQMVWGNLSPSEQIKAGQSFLGPLAELERLGFWVFTGLRQAQFDLKDCNPEPFEACIGYVVIRPKGTTIDKMGVPRVLRIGSSPPLQELRTR